jgi:hypothetical protein
LNYAGENFSTLFAGKDEDDSATAGVCDPFSDSLGGVELASDFLRNGLRWGGLELKPKASSIIAPAAFQGRLSGKSMRESVPVR